MPPAQSTTGGLAYYLLYWSSVLLARVPYQLCDSPTDLQAHFSSDQSNQTVPLCKAKQSTYRLPLVCHHYNCLTWLNIERGFRLCRWFFARLVRNANTREQWVWVLHRVCRRYWRSHFSALLNIVLTTSHSHNKQRWHAPRPVNVLRKARSHWLISVCQRAQLRPRNEHITCFCSISHRYRTLMGVLCIFRGFWMTMARSSSTYFRALLYVRWCK